MQYLEINDILTHNLKGFNLKIPLNTLVIITGPSGSGKSSLAINTIAEEGKNRFLQALNYSKEFLITSSYQAKFLTSIPPVISLTQGLKNWFPYKTAGDFFLISRFLETLFMEKGEYYCPKCNSYNRVSSINEVIKWFQELKNGTRFYFLLPLPEKSPKALEYLISQGYTKYLIDNKEVDLSEENLPLSFNKIFLVLDRMIKEDKETDRFIENLRLSLALNKGRVVLKLKSGEEHVFNLRPVCLNCGSNLCIIWKKCEACKGYGYKEKIPCKVCRGLKLDPVILKSKILGKTVEDWLNSSVEEFYNFLKKSEILKEHKVWTEVILSKLEKAIFLELNYLKLSTPVFKLSTGEKKLLELIQIFSSDLRNCLYILDEPSLGLDLGKKEKLIKLLKEIINKQSSVILIEHDPYLIKEADYIIELGPKGGEKGGYLIKACFKDEYFKNDDSLTLKYFKGKKNLCKFWQKKEEILDINCDNYNISILKKGFNIIYGKVGSGKALIFNTLVEELKKRKEKVVISETELFKKRNDWIITYLGIWDELRKIFIKTPLARMKGLTSKHFSFTSKEGVCPGCKGKGKKTYESNGIKIEFLCEDCLGKRLNSEVLNLEYKGFKISELLDFTVEEALSIFANILKIKEKLIHVNNLGLGYLKFSQEISELSGGEKVRLSLVKKLYSEKDFKYVFLEYPFQGLHLEDIKNFLNWMRILLEKDITFVILETNPLAILLADFIIEVENQKIKYTGFKEDWVKLLKDKPEFKVFEFYKNFIKKEV